MLHKRECEDGWFCFLPDIIVDPIRPAHRGCYTPSVIRRDNSICVSTERRDVAKSLITLELTAPEDCV